VPNADAEVARAWLFERFPGGFEEREIDSSTELAVYTDSVGAAEIRMCFSQATTEPVPGGWEDRWKAFHRPVRAGGLWVGPPWLAPPVGEVTVVVDPGRAFGTGAHPTTRACIELLSTLERGSLLDAGCGSGVVAIAAARLGFSPVRAVDLDCIAVEVATKTSRANAVELEIARIDVLRDELPVSDVVVANIELTVVEELLGRVPATVAVTSGYPTDERPRARGWIHVQRMELEGWAADVFARAALS
jgi:ribosomal protein L11 methyltransferase